MEKNQFILHKSIKYIIFAKDTDNMFLTANRTLFLFEEVGRS